MPSSPDVPSADPAHELSRISAIELHDRITTGSITAVQATQAALERIEATNPLVRAVIAVHPEVRAQAASLDASRATRGPLHGVPVLVKDNIDMAGMPTTAGSLALAEHRPASDAFLTARLREAGAVLVGKANLSEWANFRSTQSTSGWSAVGGQCRNPHVLDRSPCGSSSGSAVAVAVGMVPLAVGTETDGSILCPASVNGVVGVKPTVGLVSRDGIVPISPTQDTAGPVARTVADAALLLEVLAARDARDPAAQWPADLDTAYVDALSQATLSGARIGVISPDPEFDPRVVALYRTATDSLAAHGAELVPIPALEPTLAATAGEHEWQVLLAEFEPALEAYLTQVQGLSTLSDLIAFNRAHADTELRWFQQEIFESAAALDPADRAATADHRTAARQAMANDYIDAHLEAHRLDALVAITSGPAWPIDPVLGDRDTGGSSHLTAIPGYPAVTVPMGTVEGLPVGLSFLGTAYSERRLLQLAHAHEQIHNARVWPPLRSTLAN